MTFWGFPDHTIDPAADYMQQFDNMFLYAQRFMSSFNCQETDPPSMSIQVLPGFIWNGSEVVEIPGATSAAIPVPLVFRRFDRIVLNPLDGSLVHIQGDNRGNLPKIPGGWMPLCHFEIHPDSFEINNSMITDERALAMPRIPGIRLVYTDTVLTSSDLGSTIVVGNGPAEIILPPLQLLSSTAKVPIGQSISIVSLNSTRQVIFPYPGTYDRGDGTIVQDFLDGDAFGYRLPSFANVRVHKLVSNSWSFTQKPAYSLGQIIEHTVPIDNLPNVLGLGWVACDGRQLSRTDFGNLGDVYFDGSNYQWGNGDGSTTFNVPYFPGRATVRSGQGTGLTNRPFGFGSGQDTEVITQAQLPSYNFTVNDPGHTHVFSPSGSYLRQTGSGTRMTQGSGGGQSNANIVLSSKSNISITSGGLSSAHNNVQPFNVKHKFVRY